MHRVCQKFSCLMLVGEIERFEWVMDAVGRLRPGVVGGCIAAAKQVSVNRLTLGSVAMHRS